MDSKKDHHDTICCGRPDCHPLAAERFTQRNCLAFVADRSIDADFPYRVDCSIFPFAQGLGESPLADLVAARRNLHLQGFMRSLVVVNLPPGIKAPLAGRHVRPGLTLEDLDIERPMETLIFALGLRMERSTVADSDAQLEQPDRQSRPRSLRAGGPPGRAVVAEDALRQPEAAEDRREMSLHGLAPLVGTGAQPQAISGMVVEDGQGMTTSGRGGEVPFEIHLPELVGPIALEADKGTRGRAGLDEAVT